MEERREKVATGLHQKKEHRRQSRKHGIGAPQWPAFKAECRAELGSLGGYMTICDTALATAMSCKANELGMQGSHHVSPCDPPHRPAPY